MTLTPDQAKWLFDMLRRTEDEHHFECQAFSDHHGWEPALYICSRCGENIKDKEYKAAFHDSKPYGYYTFPDDKFCSIPNLVSPGWPEFGWVWERAKEKEWWEDFLSWFEDDWSLLVHPPRFIGTLYEFLEKKE